MPVDTPTHRTRKPRPPVVVRPSFVSQETCLQVLGVDARRFLDLVVPRCGNEVTKLGKLRLVPLAVAEDALARLASAEDSDDDTGGQDAPAANERQPQTADEVLAALGFERAPAR